MPELPLDKPMRVAVRKAVHVDAKEAGSCYERLVDGTRMIETFNGRLQAIKEKFSGSEPEKDSIERETIDNYQDLLNELGKQVTRMNNLLSYIEDVI
ncbi:hypothetical protein LCGC14_1632400 [marine sediment metagenome]|uniref:Uncharacterized protein n=1 Tax=marine sediment metagenome TaxID=412755 RepID=A0A0F9IPG7_9ZZZZ